MSADSSEHVLLGARVEQSLKNLVDADGRTNQEVVNSALWKEFGGQRQSSLETRIEHKNRQIDAIQAEIDALKEERDKKVQERSALEDKLDRMDTAESSYYGDLDDILDAKESGEREAAIIPETLEKVAKKYGKNPDDVHEDIIQRAVEQRRELTTSMFESNLHADNSVTQMVYEVWGDDDGE